VICYNQNLGLDLLGLIAKQWRMPGMEIVVGAIVCVGWWWWLHLLMGFWVLRHCVCESLIFLEGLRRLVNFWSHCWLVLG